MSSNYEIPGSGVRAAASGIGAIVIILLGIVIVLGMLIGIGFACEGANFFVYQWFAPKYEQVRYDTFKQSQSYNDGMQQELDNMRMQYVHSDSDGKAAMASIILHRVGGYDENRLSPDLRLFVDSLRVQSFASTRP